MAAKRDLGSISFTKVYPLYLNKVEKKGRTKDELDQVILWLTGFSAAQLNKVLSVDTTYRELFEQCTVNPNAHLITGVVCGHRVEEIEDELTQKGRYLDKLVDELARGRKMDKILRTPKDS